MKVLNFNYLINSLKILFTVEKKNRNLLNKINHTHCHDVSIFLRIRRLICKLSKRFQLFKCIVIDPDNVINIGLLTLIFGLKIIIIDSKYKKNSFHNSLKKNFPNIKIDFNGYKSLIKKYKSLDNGFKKNNIIYLKKNDISKLPKNYFNFAINIESFQEMKNKTFINYIEKIGHILKPNNFFILITKKKLISFNDISLIKRMGNVDLKIIYNEHNIFMSLKKFYKLKILTICIQKNINNIF